MKKKRQWASKSKFLRGTLKVVEKETSFGEHGLPTTQAREIFRKLNKLEARSQGPRGLPKGEIKSWRKTGGGRGRSQKRGHSITDRMPRPKKSRTRLHRPEHGKIPSNRGFVLDGSQQKPIWDGEGEKGGVRRLG